MKKHELEATFSYKGFNCVVVKIGLDWNHRCMLSPWRCGYVELKEENKGLTEDDVECLIDCHGGITFYGTREFYGLGLSIGFDCNHLGDSLETCSLEYCISQCKKIADQLDILANGDKLQKVETDRDEVCDFCSSGNLFNDPIAESSHEVCGITLFNAEVFIAYGDKLKLHLSNSNDDFIGGACSKINYCPICGRKLEPTAKDVMDEIYDTNPEEYDRIMNRLSGGEE